MIFFTSIFTELCNHHCSLSLEHFQETSYLLAITPYFPYPSPWQPQIYSLSLWICLFWIFHINGIIWDVAFYVWFLSLSKVHPCCGMFFISFMPEEYSSVWIYHILSVDGHLGFHLLAITNNAVNIHVQALCGTAPFWGINLRQKSYLWLFGNNRHINLQWTSIETYLLVIGRLR